MSDIPRRTFLKQSTLATLGVAAIRSGLVAGVEEGARSIGDEPQLLLDDWIIERQAGLHKTLHQPKKQGLIKEADGTDWQRGDVRSVVRDRKGRLHMVYRYTWWDPTVRDLHPNIGEDRAHWFHQSTGYATSDDGHRWHKPNLGLIDAPTGFRKINEFPFEVPLGFSKNNNLACPIESAREVGVGDSAQKRLMVRYAFRDGTHPFAGVTEEGQCYADDWPDVVHDQHWKEKLTPIPGFNGWPRGSLVGYDPRAAVWMTLGQDQIPRWISRGGRDIIRCTSSDMKRWSQPELVLPVADDEPRQSRDWVEYMEMAASWLGGPKTGVWLGQLVVFHSDRSNPEFEMPTIRNVWRKGFTELRLMTSRDAGATWQRVGGNQVWLPHHGEENGFDRMLYVGCFVPIKDTLHFYYPAWDGEHLTFKRNGEPYYSNRMRIGRTALATLRRDGFVSLDAGAETGSCTTRILRFDGKELTVNATARRGKLRAELQTASGRPLEGFSIADCEPVRGDGVSLPVRWRGAEAIAAHAGKPIRVRFDLQEASLFAFQFT